METRLHSRSDKRIDKALSTFSKACAQVYEAIELKELSIMADNEQMREIESEISRLETLLDTLQAGIIRKRGEIEQHKDLASRLELFTP